MMMSAGTVAAAGKASSTPGIISALGTDGGSPPAAWLDGILTGSTEGVWSQWYAKDFGAGKTVTKIRLVGATSRGANTNGGTGGIEAEHSDDGSTWTAAGSVTGVAGVNAANWIATLNLSAGSHRHWRWRGTNTAGDGSLFLAESEWTGY